MEDKTKKDKVNPRLEQLFVNETGFREIGMNIQRQLDAMDNSMKMHFLEEIFEDTFIFRVSDHTNNRNSYFRQSYLVKDDGGEVELGAGTTEVRKHVETTFETLEQKSNSMTRRKKFSRKEKKTMSEVKNGSPCKVDALIANEASKWTQEDKEWLLTLDEGQIDKMTPEPKEEKKEVIKNVTTATTEKKETPEVTEDQIKAILNKSDDPVAFIDKFVPAALGDQMKQGLKVYNDKRAKLIEEIVANSKFTKERLESFETEDLENLHESSVPELSDYSVLGEQSRKVEKQVTEDMKIILNLGEEEKPNNESK